MDDAPGPSVAGAAPASVSGGPVDADADLDRQREEGIAKALEVTKLLRVHTRLAADVDAALADLRVAAEALGDAALTKAERAVERALAHLRVMLSRAAGDADADEFDKVRSAIDILVTAVTTATDQAREEALVEKDPDEEDDQVVAVAMIMNTIDASDAVAGLPPRRRDMEVARLVEDDIVLVVDGKAVVYDRTAPEAPWVAVSDRQCACAHVLSGGRVTLIDDATLRYVSPDGAYRATADLKLQRRDKRRVFRALPGGMKGSCVVRVAQSLVAVSESGALHSLSLEGNGRWSMLYDRLELRSAAYVHGALVVVTADGRVLETQIDGDLACVNHFTSWYVVAGTGGLRATNVGYRAPDGMTLTHPDGRIAQLHPDGAVSLRSTDDSEDLALSVGRPDGLYKLDDGFVALDVMSGRGKGLDSLTHFDYAACVRPYKPRDFTFAWKFVPGPEGRFHVYNDFTADAWLGYDLLTDRVVVVSAASPDRVAWAVAPAPAAADVCEM